MGINRRHFTLLLGATVLAPQVFASNRKPDLLFASAAKTAAGQYQLIVVDQAGGLQLRHTLPARAHHIARHPFRPLLAAVGRRPETFIDLVDLDTGTLHKRIQSAPGYHFFGHAIFSDDGRYLISTENQIESGSGMVVIRDAEQDYSISRQFTSGGIGPHELKLMADGRTLVVANGGILTHPSLGRKKLNLETMQPNLAYIDIESGQLLESHGLPAELHQLSIRHFDINAAGVVAMALQYQGDRSDDVPLVALHKRGQPIQLLKAPLEVNRAMKQYAGSARFDQSGEYAAISCPRGNVITFWSQSSGAFVHSVTSADGCGLAKTEQAGEFLITTGRGRCERFNLMDKTQHRYQLSTTERLAWDNHASSFF